MKNGHGVHKAYTTNVDAMYLCTFPITRGGLRILQSTTYGCNAYNSPGVYQVVLYAYYPFVSQLPRKVYFLIRGFIKNCIGSFLIDTTTSCDGGYT